MDEDTEKLLASMREIAASGDDFHCTNDDLRRILQIIDAQAAELEMLEDLADSVEAEQR